MYIKKGRDFQWLNQVVSQQKFGKIFKNYIRFRGSYGEFRKQSGKLVKELFEFATANHLIDRDKTKVLTMYDDNPYITQEQNLRTSVAMTVSNGIAIIESTNVCVSNISGEFGVGHFEIAAKE